MFCGSGFSNGIKIIPVRVNIALPKRIETIQIHNLNEDPLLIQAEITSWKQNKGNDVFYPTSDIIVLPSIVSIPAGQTQQIRIAFQGAPSEIEETYRLFLTEVNAKTSKIKKNAFNVRLRISLPIFIEPLNETEEIPQWELAMNKKTANVTLLNSGNRHMLVENISLLDEENCLLADNKVFKYVLPKQSFSWKIPLMQQTHSNKLSIQSQINGQPHSTQNSFLITK